MTPIHPEGIQILLVFFSSFLILTLTIYYFLSKKLAFFIGSILTILFGFMVYFFRNPERTTVSTENEIIAPADGEVVIIKNVFEKEYLKKNCKQISIFMSPLNVHVNRYPFSGEVTYTKYHPGKYLFAWLPKSSELNERTTVVVKNKNNQEILFRQIAGALARRIVLYAKTKDIAIAGGEYGFIKFGSRVDVYLPLDAKILVKIGDKPVGGVTKIAELVSK
ncbi:MAG: phosphatidylserine decarboxylase family protein [Solirubrobacteraceae bacterium]